MKHATSTPVSGVRTQLSLPVPPALASEVEAVRRAVDPVQSRLIPAHVTLCREEELVGVDVHSIEAAFADAEPLTLVFGQAECFGTHGILLPCVAGHDAFEALRARILPAFAARRQRPHLTLAHPRNPPVSGDTLTMARSLPAPLAVTFRMVQSIEQMAGAPWRVRQTFHLGRVMMGR